MISTFLEKKDTMETSKQEEDVVVNVAFTVYGGSYQTKIMYDLFIKLEIKNWQSF